MVFGIDVHGVITTKKKFFIEFTKRLISTGHKVHIITGATVNDKLMKEIEGVSYTKIFSIIDYHKELGTPISYTDKDNPWMDKKLWNSTKAWYCKKHNVDLMIDDSDTYGKYFKTLYLKLKG